ncbi:helix-turn-helix domain-containing protein [Yersinia enterocolitica]|uniref:helix-turn-helix domain-containing protein n=1 Tax=Yersinia enterocolitica TaxID=630 RepID=UPI001CA5AE12|nr:helix-turn-helix domain-containing protein [Yersinia enterocolitica]MBW5835489.1 helix-turn-helix domain-containing protein [Yersinia enterocolitica]
MLKKMTINAILQYIEDNLEVSYININNLVSFSGYSRRYLQLLFKIYMGIPIGKYIQMRRASRAAFLLRLTNKPIIEISEKLLYDSQQTFTREFKKITGYTPKRYRTSPNWSFKNIIGYRKVDYLPPKPMICRLKKREIFGHIFEHRNGIIPCIIENSHHRWQEIDKKLKHKNKITLSNRFTLINNKPTLSTIIWGNLKNSCCKIIIDGGLYARFSFSGTFDEYSNYIKNIYENSLSAYKLDKRDTYDIEVIYLNNGILHYHYYIPVCESHIMCHDLSTLD